MIFYYIKLFSENSIGSRDLNFDGRLKIFGKGLKGTKVKGPVTLHFGSGHFHEIQTTLFYGMHSAVL